MDLEKQMELLCRGAVAVLPSREALRERLSQGGDLQVKVGIDPTGSDLHLGHLVVLRKVRQFQNLGHRAIFVVGDFTAQVGDPSGHTRTRQPLSPKQAVEHGRTYEEQALLVLDRERTKVVNNSKWLAKMDIQDLLQLARKVQVAELVNRDDFQARLASRQSFLLDEFLYSLLQAYDSVHLQTDIEVGGEDQRFNMAAAQTIQAQAGQKPQISIIMPLLTGTMGGLKMSKTFGNAVWLRDPPSLIYTKVMAIPETVVLEWVELLTGQSLQRSGVKKEISDYRPLKKQLAEDIIRQLHSDREVDLARAAWEKRFETPTITYPEEMATASIAREALKDDAIWVVELVFRMGFSEGGIPLTRAAIRRLIDQGLVFIDGIPAISKNVDVPIRTGTIVSLGHERFRRVEVVP